MGKDKWGRVKLGEERIYTLQYADDIVLIAEDEDQLEICWRGLKRTLRYIFTWRKKSNIEHADIKGSQIQEGRGKRKEESL